MFIYTVDPDWLRHTPEATREIEMNCQRTQDGPASKRLGECVCVCLCACVCVWRFILPRCFLSHIYFPQQKANTKISTAGFCTFNFDSPPIPSGYLLHMEPVQRSVLHNTGNGLEPWQWLKFFSSPQHPYLLWVPHPTPYSIITGRLLALERATVGWDLPLTFLWERN